MTVGVSKAKDAADRTFWEPPLRHRRIPEERLHAHTGRRPHPAHGRALPSSPPGTSRRARPARRVSAPRPIGSGPAGLLCRPRESAARHPLSISPAHSSLGYCGDGLPSAAMPAESGQGDRPRVEGSRYGTSNTEAGRAPDARRKRPAGPADPFLTRVRRNENTGGGPPPERPVGVGRPWRAEMPIRAVGAVRARADARAGGLDLGIQAGAFARRPVHRLASRREAVLSPGWTSVASPGCTNPTERPHRLRRRALRAARDARPRCRSKRCGTRPLT